MRRALLPALIAAVLTAAVAAVAVAADPPAATTGAVKDLTQSTATLTATVDPKGSATTVEFDLGTDASYGLKSPSKDVPAGTEAVTVEIPVRSLTPNTSYHFRVVATSPGGTATGADASFRTPSRPTVTTGSVRNTVNDGGTLTGSVIPRGQATQAHFEYGTTTSLGTSTPAVDVGSGAGSAPVTADVRGLAPNTRYHYRLIAANASGTTRGSDRTFVTGAAPSGVTLVADHAKVPYGRGGAVTGRVRGPKLGGIRVRLQTSPFPFTSPFADFGPTTSTSSTGSFRLSISPLLTTTRAVVIAGSPGVQSSVVTLRSVARVGLSRVERHGRRLAVIGRMSPATTAGVVTLQRRTRTGRWARIGRAGVAIDGSYVIRLKPRRDAMLVRAVGAPRDGGAHETGVSRRVRIRGAQR